jgi:hypothetical protein
MDDILDLTTQANIDANILCRGQRPLVCVLSSIVFRVL